MDHHHHPLRPAIPPQCRILEGKAGGGQQKHFCFPVGERKHTKRQNYNWHNGIFLLIAGKIVMVSRGKIKKQQQQIHMKVIHAYQNCRS